MESYQKVLLLASQESLQGTLITVRETQTTPDDQGPRRRPPPVPPRVKQKPILGLPAQPETGSTSLTSNRSMKSFTTAKSQTKPHQAPVYIGGFDVLRGALMPDPLSKLLLDQEFETNIHKLFQRAYGAFTQEATDTLFCKGELELRTLPPASNDVVRAARHILSHRKLSLAIDCTETLRNISWCPLEGSGEPHLSFRNKFELELAAQNGSQRAVWLISIEELSEMFESYSSFLLRVADVLPQIARFSDCHDLQIMLPDDDHRDAPDEVICERLQYYGTVHVVLDSTKPLVCFSANDHLLLLSVIETHAQRRSSGHCGDFFGCLVYAEVMLLVQEVLFVERNFTPGIIQGKLQALSSGISKAVVLFKASFEVQFDQFRLEETSTDCQKGRIKDDQSTKWIHDEYNQLWAEFNAKAKRGLSSVDKVIGWLDWQALKISEQHFVLNSTTAVDE